MYQNIDDNSAALGAGRIAHLQAELCEAKVADYLHSFTEYCNHESVGYINTVRSKI